MDLKSGQIYRHFKNPEHQYRIIGLAKHSESLEDLVVYEALYDNELGRLWVRPLSMWTEIIDRDGYHGPRFILVSEK